MKQRRLRYADWGWTHDSSVRLGSPFYVRRAAHVARAREAMRVLGRYRVHDDAAWAAEALAFLFQEDSA